MRLANHPARMLLSQVTYRWHLEGWRHTLEPHAGGAFNRTITLPSDSLAAAPANLLDASALANTHSGANGSAGGSQRGAASVHSLLSMLSNALVRPRAPGPASTLGRERGRHYASSPLRVVVC